MQDYNYTEDSMEDIEATPENTATLMRMNEKDILQGLLAAADYKQDEDAITPIEIVRAGKVLFSFRIRPLSEEEYNKCKKKHTKLVRNKKLGIVVSEETNTAKYRSALIYTATIPEDREKVWDNRDAWSVLNVLGGIDLIDMVLLAGEKDAVLDKLDKISGYETTLEETAKN